MDAQQALADLTEISSQVEAAIVVRSTGKLLGSTFEDAAHAEELAASTRELLEAAESLPGGDERQLTQLEAATQEGSVFVVRDDALTIAATTGRNPTVGLVFYDLKSCLRSAEATLKRKPAKPRDKAPEKPAAKKPAKKKKPDAP